MPQEQVVVPARTGVRVGNQEIVASPSWSGRPIWPASQLSADRLLHDAENPLGPRHRPRPAVLLFRLWRGRAARSSIDTLTGEYQVERVDILHDVGKLAEPGDRHRPDRGRLHPGHGLADHRGAVVGQARAGCAPTRPRPTRSRSRPTGRAIFNVRAGRMVRRTASRPIYRSKAVGEPPLMLAISVLHALSDAVASVAGLPRCARGSTRRRRPRRC